MARKSPWRLALLYVSLTVLCIAGVGGLALREMLKDPNAGTLRGVFETDESVNEMRIIAFNSGRMKAIKRSEKAHISRLIETELRSAGFAPLLPTLTATGRNEWTLSRQVGFPGPQIQIHGSAACDPQVLANRLPENVLPRLRQLENGAFQLSAYGRGHRRLSVSFFPRETARYQINLMLEPKEGTPPIKESDLVPFTKGKVTSLPRAPQEPRKHSAS